MKDTVCGMIRPAYEVDQFVAALLISLLYLTLARLLPCLQVPSLAISGLFGMYAIFKVTAVARQIRFVLCFIGADRPIVKTDKDLLSITNDKSRGDALQLGYGFAWQPQHLRNARDILDMNIAEYRTQALCRYELWKILKTQPLVFLFHPWSTFRQINGQKDLIAIKRGATWIQTLEYCKPRFLPRSELTPHTLITGSSGAGKTSALRWICAQEIARKRIVIIVDPKGDKGLYTCSKLFTKKCCREFHEFNAAHPERSEALNLLSNFKEVSELASRISQVLPSSGESAVFNEMGRNALAAVAQKLRQQTGLWGASALFMASESGYPKRESSIVWQDCTRAYQVIIRSLSCTFEYARDCGDHQFLANNRRDAGQNHYIYPQCA